MAHHDDESTANAQTLESQIEELHGHLFPVVGDPDFRAFWVRAKSLREAFKQTRLRRDARERLWARYGELCQEAKNFSQAAREKLARNSREKRDIILREIKDSVYAAQDARSAGELAKAGDRLHQVPTMMKTGWDGFNVATSMVSDITGDEGKLTKEDREHCWQEFTEAKEKLRYRRQELQGDDYHNFRHRIIAVSDIASSGDPYEAQNQVKEVQRDLRTAFMEKAQYQEIRDSLDTLWRTASERIGERKREKAEKAEAYRQKQVEWEERQRGHIERWQSYIDKNESAISRIHDQISDLEEKVGSARTEEFADTVRGWIDERLEKISDIQSRNSELETKIADVTSKL